jgi:dihydroorotase
MPWIHYADEPYLSQGGIAHSGSMASRLGLPGIPVIAETIALYTLFELMRVTGARVHVCRVSSARGVELIRAAKAEGLLVSCDVGVHHIHMTDMDIGFFDANARIFPPFRSQRDRDAIRSGLQDGTIDAICSDHTPVDDDEKTRPFGEAAPGVTGLELLLSLVLKWRNECLDFSGAWSLAMSKITSQPARIGQFSAGDLSVGKMADLCLFDPNVRWKVSPENLASQGKHTPFLGYELDGKVKMTIVGGQVVFERI